MINRSFINNLINMKLFLQCIIFLAIQITWLNECLGLGSFHKTTLLPDADEVSEEQNASALEDLKNAKLDELTQKRNESAPSEDLSREETDGHFALDFSFKNQKKNLRFAQVTDNQFNYLLIPSAQKYCEGSSILLATTANDLGVTAVQTAEQRCNEIPGCSFFSLSQSGNGYAWFCTGDDWITVTPKINWLTAVKHEYLQSMTPNYSLKVNTAVTCSGNNRLEEAKGPTSIETAAKTCDSDPRCSYFAINFESSKMQTVYYCSGSATNLVPSDNWLYAERRRLTKGSTEINPETGLAYGTPVVMKPMAQGASVVQNRGSITQDNYYDSQHKGAIIPPIKMG